MSVIVLTVQCDPNHTSAVNLASFRGGMSEMDFSASDRHKRGQSSPFIDGNRERDGPRDTAAVRVVFGLRMDRLRCTQPSVPLIFSSTHVRPGLLGDSRSSPSSKHCSRPGFPESQDVGYRVKVVLEGRRSVPATPKELSQRRASSQLRARPHASKDGKRINLSRRRSMLCFVRISSP